MNDINQTIKTNVEKVPRRILGGLLAGLSAGVVPRAGAPYIAIGRREEIRAISADMERVAEGQSATRFVIGRYGSGKSFLLQLLRSYAIENGYLCADADLSPERRLAGEGGLLTYRELMRNLSCKASPDGEAWSLLLQKWLRELSDRADEAGDSRSLALIVSKELAPLRDEIGGADYVSVLTRYAEGYETDNDSLTAAALAWLRGEYRTKTEARAALSLRSVNVIDDALWYVHLRLLARLARIMGYRGLLVLIDECVNLYKIPNRISREANYEKILSVYNDTLQGTAQGMMFVFGGTPQFLEDTRRGLFSYEALRSRLSDARFGDGTGLVNRMSPVIRLRPLSGNDLLALAFRLRALHAQYYNTAPAVTDEQAAQFINLEFARAGADTMLTPREIIRDFVTLLDLLMQNADATFEQIVGQVTSAPASNGEADTPADGDGEAPAPASPASVELPDFDL